MKSKVTNIIETTQHLHGYIMITRNNGISRFYKLTLTNHRRMNRLISNKAIKLQYGNPQMRVFTSIIKESK